MRRIANVYRLGIKEIYSLLADPVLMGLIVFTFTFSVYSVAHNVQTELRNASIAIVDEDHSVLSTAIAGAFLQPYFQPPRLIDIKAVDAAMDAGRYTFVLDIPPGFEKDVLAGRDPVLQLNVDATAMTIAGTGAGYIQSIVNTELLTFVGRAEGQAGAPVSLQIRAMYNPNLHSSWFLAVMQILDNVTVLAIILGGAAVIREREHGTLEHLLVMPVTSCEIMLAKIWANGLVIVIAALLVAGDRRPGLPGHTDRGLARPLRARCRRLSLCDHGAGHPALDHRHDHAAVRPALDPRLRRDEHALGRPDADREHAALPADRGAGPAVGAFRHLRPGRPLSRCRPGHRLAPAARHGAARRRLLHPDPASPPRDPGSGALDEACGPPGRQAAFMLSL